MEIFKESIEYLDMNDPKILFVKKFLATLFQKDIKTIPINDDSFQRGIDNMSAYYHEHSADFGSSINVLDILFLKYSTRGDYRSFSSIIESFNGRLVSLENPHYVKANLKFKDNYDTELIENNQLGIAQASFDKLAQCFCEGAGIVRE